MLFLYPALQQRRFLFGADVVDHFYHWRTFSAHWLRQGILPLWNPHVFCGVPALQARLWFPLTWLWVLVLYASLGLSNLAKGPGGIAVVALTLTAFLLFTRDRAFRRRLHLFWGLLIIVAVNLPWMVLVQLRTEGEFLHRIIRDHLLAHTLRGKEGHGAIFLIYIPLLAVFFFPWSVFLPRAVGRMWRGRGDWRRLFLILWAGLGFLLFCFVRTKLPHYLLPLYPALSLMVRNQSPPASWPSKALTEKVRVMSSAEPPSRSHSA